MNLGYVDTSLSEEGYRSSAAGRQRAASSARDSGVAAWVSGALSTTVGAGRGDRAAMLGSPQSGSSRSSGHSGGFDGPSRGSAFSAAAGGDGGRSSGSPLPAHAGAYGKPAKRRPSRRRPSPQGRDFQNVATARLPPTPALYVIGCEFCERFSYYVSFPPLNYCFTFLSLRVYIFFLYMYTHFAVVVLGIRVLIFMFSRFVHFLFVCHQTRACARCWGSFSWSGSA